MVLVLRIESSEDGDDGGDIASREFEPLDA